jgi:hypothetical protein
MVYAEGTSTGTFAAGSYTFGVGATLTKGQTTNQNVLASRISPPIKPRLSIWLIIGAFILSQLIAAISFGFLPYFSVYLGVLAGLMALGYSSNASANSRELRNMKRIWLCGNVAGYACDVGRIGGGLLYVS